MTFSRGTSRSVKRPERAGVNNWLGTCFGGVKLKLDVENFPSNFRPGRVSPKVSYYVLLWILTRPAQSNGHASVTLPSPLRKLVVRTNLYRSRPSVWFSTIVFLVFFKFFLFSNAVYHVNVRSKTIMRKIEFESVCFVRFCTRIVSRAFKSCQIFSFRTYSNR